MNSRCRSKKSNIRAGAFHLTQMVDYGLFFLSVLANGKDPQSIRSIAKKYNLSFSFLQKVANRLKHAELVRASRGKVGGYVLVCRPSEVTMKQIVEALDNPIALMDCLLESHVRARTCPRERFCSVRRGLARMNNQIREIYTSKTLAEFILSDSSVQS
ncbi:Rrf2 family transcriptional regulator [Candidatus Uhrbacteria bacterium]|nr:Rrf2 family transcriptional regulator [Candidatus Uhrbacteria bacterium]